MSRAVGGADQGADQEVERLAGEVCFVPAVRAIRAAMDELDMDYTVRNPVQGEAAHKVLAWRVLVAGLSALAGAGYTVVKTRYEYAGMYMHEGREDTRIRRVVGPWEPIPERCLVPVPEGDEK